MLPLLLSLLTTTRTISALTPSCFLATTWCKWCAVSYPANNARLGTDTVSICNQCKICLRALSCAPVPIHMSAKKRKFSPSSSKLKSTAKRVRVNLNDVRIDDKSWHAVTDVSDCAQVTVVFDGISDRLVAEIERAVYVVGCVAWLSDWRVLDALASRHNGGVALVVHEERGYGRGKGRFDSVRAHRAWTTRLKQAYEALPSFAASGGPPAALRDHALWRRVVGFSRSNQKRGAPAVLDTVRCLGPPPAATPVGAVCNNARMHHKFLVFGDSNGRFYAAWTGSFNPTPNASQSTENAVVLYDSRVADAFLNEFVQLALASKPAPTWCRPAGKRQRYELTPKDDDDDEEGGREQ